MNRIACAAVACALLALCTGAAADEKEQKVLAAVDAFAGSIVKVEYECAQSDGRGSQEFSTTGIVVGADGLVMVTDVNAVDPPVGGPFQKPAAYVVNFDKDVKAKAKLLGKDEELNLALLRIAPDEEPEEGAQAPVIRPLPLTRTEGLTLAQEILILNRLGKGEDFRPTFALFRVTAVIPKPAGPPEYRLDGALAPWAGCPVVSLDGRVLGFVGLEAAEPGGGGGRTINIGGRTIFMGGRGRRSDPRILCTGDFEEFLADPSKFLRRKCWLGVRGLQAAGKDLAEQLKVPEGGVILGEILAQSPAERGGLLAGDVVLKVNGEDLGIAEDKDVEKFTKRIQRAAGGEILAFTVYRKAGDAYVATEIRVTLEEEPVQEFEVEEWEEKTFGLSVKPLTRDFLDRERLPLTTKGVRVTRTENAGFANLAGLRRDDIIHGVVLVKTPDLEALKGRLKEVIAKREPEVCFGVLRGGKDLFLCVRPEWGLVDAGAGGDEEKK